MDRRGFWFGVSVLQTKKPSDGFMARPAVAGMEKGERRGPGSSTFIPAAPAVGVFKFI